MCDQEDALEEIIEEREGRIVRLRLNRPESLNAFSQGMMRYLHDAFPRLSADMEVGAIIVEGAGRSFCVGGDVKSWGDRADWTYEKHSEEYRWKQRIALAMRQCSKIIVAALQGHVLGAGFGLALAADFRVAGRSAIFGTSFAGVGLSGDFGTTSSLVNLVGSAKARELMILNERFGAEEAHRLGLVTQLVDDADVTRTANELAEQVAEGPYLAFGHMKRNVMAAESESFATIIELEGASQSSCCMTGDHREAIKAFAENRKPVFRGR
jgi:2-(1,2-epoxy-1,2-dihydrophenyl)acetyl-CoA isomerase